MMERVRVVFAVAAEDADEDASGAVPELQAASSRRIATEDPSPLGVDIFILVASGQPGFFLVTSERNTCLPGATCRSGDVSGTRRVAGPLDRNGQEIEDRIYNVMDFDG
jgi:hypothetical protein